MIEQEIKKLLDFVKYYAKCPCCQKEDVCTDECTFETDSPGGHAEMLVARDLLERVQ